MIFVKDSPLIWVSIPQPTEQTWKYIWNFTCILSHLSIVSTNDHRFLAKPVYYFSMIKGIFRDHSSDNALKRFVHFGNGIIRCMNITLKGIVKICPHLSQRHYILSLKKITGDFFRTDNQPTVGTQLVIHNTIKFQNVDIFYKMCFILVLSSAHARRIVSVKGCVA